MGSFDHPANGTSKKPRVQRNDVMGITGDGKSGYEFSKGDEKVYVFPPRPSTFVEIQYEGPQFLNSAKDPNSSQTMIKLDSGCKMTEFISKHFGIMMGPTDCELSPAQLAKNPMMNKVKAASAKKVCAWMSENGMLESTAVPRSQPRPSQLAK